MIDRKLVRMAQRLWDVPYQPREVNRYNRRAWIKAVKQLGPRWIALRHYGRLPDPIA